jgi:cell division transport system permease protein
MKHWLRLHWLSLIATIKYFITSPLTTCLNIIVIGLTISLPLGLFVILSSGKAVMRDLPRDPQLTIFMHVDVTQQERNDLKILLEKYPEIEKVRFISKEEGLKELTEHSGLTNLIGGLSDNPLPDAFVVTLKDPTPERLEALQKHVREESGVESVLVDAAWARRLMALFAVGEMVLNVLTVALGAGLILITGNSIRLQILTRLDEIEVSKLIGATDAFIRRPFVYFGVLQGIAGGLVGCGLIWLALYYINPSISAFAALYNAQFVFKMPEFSTVLIICAMAAFLCLVGAVFSVWRHLRRFT